MRLHDPLGVHPIPESPSTLRPTTRGAPRLLSKPSAHSQRSSGTGWAFSLRLSPASSQERKRHININKFFRRLPGPGGSHDRVGGGVSRPVARGQKFMCCVGNPRNINVFVRVPGREESGSRPGGSVTGVTEKLFMCQMFMCLLRPLSSVK